MTVQDPMAYEGTRMTPELAAEYRAQGQWREEPVHAALLAAAARRPAAVAALSVSGTDGRVRDRVTYAELSALSARLAGGLAELGLGAAGAVALMLPNRLEFSALVFAISRLGAIYTGIPTAAGVREAGFMLRRCGARVLVVAREYRGADHVELAGRLLDEAPELRHVVVLDGAPTEPRFVAFERVADAAPVPDDAPVHGGALAQIGFTSGTTGEPKGVMNTHECLEAVSRNWVEHVGGPAAFGDPLVNFIPSPVGHHTGYIWGALLSARLAGTAVYLDRWNPAVAAAVIAREQVTAMTGAPTFTQDLMRIRGLHADSVPALRTVTLSGAPIPRDLVPAAAERLGAYVCPAWGMTEYGIGISGSPRLPLERVIATDGVPVPGCEARVTSGGRPLPPGSEGDLEIRGPGLFLGYYQRPDFTADAIVDGWFRTGDVARIDEDGMVALLGRTKDIVIRGGENIPVVEVETVLFRHPRIVDAAIIGVPDERLGERACAVVVCEDEPVALQEVIDFCLDQGLSKHYLPERLEIVDALPKTMSGKIRKVELRERYGSA